jgi:hypothetical protein
VRGVQQRLCQGPIVGQQQQTLRVEVEAPTG